MEKIDTIIFDLGAVLIDWNPRYVYRQLFVNEETVNYFLENICTTHWNEEQDAGRSFAEATSSLVEEYPHYQSEIEAYYGRWEEMLGEAIVPTVSFLEYLKNTNKYKLLALTNWSAESFPIALNKFPFLHWFDGIVVSGEEKCKKPDPKIYNILLSRYDAKPSKALFIDDNIHNIQAARGLGIKSVHFTTPQVTIQECLVVLGDEEFILQ